MGGVFYCLAVVGSSLENLGVILNFIYKVDLSFQCTGLDPIELRDFLDELVLGAFYGGFIHELVYLYNLFHLGIFQI